MDASRDAAKAQRQQAAAQRQQAELQRRAADVQNARQIRNAIKQARIARAAVINTGASAGTMGSSGVLGGAGSVQSLLASNIGYFNQLDDLNSGILDTQVAQANAIEAQGQAYATSATWGALGQLGGTIFNATDESGNGWKTIFGTGKKR